MSDSSAIDAALVAKLGSDPELLAMMPNGVYWDLAPQESLRYVLVSLSDTEDMAQFGARAIESVLYLVKAVGCSVENPAIRQAAARIDVLLEDQSLVVEGYGWMSMSRERRVRYTEPDESNHSITWFHRGGLYRVQVTPATP